MFRVIILYLVAGWIVIEVSATVLPGLNLPDWAPTLVIVLVALGFPVALGMAWAFDLGPDGVTRTGPAKAAAAPPAAEAKPSTPPRVRSPDERSIAVLPFLNMSGDKENEYFSDGIAEEILNLLVKLPQLKVASRTSSFVFKGRTVNIRTVADELGVATVLEGSVRQSGGRVRITAQLIDAATDTHMWSETYDRELKDVFAIQDEIASNIVRALEVELSDKEKEVLAKAPTESIEAYDYYLRGRQAFYGGTRKADQAAIEMMKKAIELDPGYALAYAGLADAYAWEHMYFDGGPASLDRAVENARKALELDPELAQAHCACGTALSLSRSYDEAAREFEEAIRLNPNLFDAFYFYARMRFVQGRTEEAARLMVAATEKDPEDFQSQILLGGIFTQLNLRGKATQHQRRGVEMAMKHLEADPDHLRAMYLAANAAVELGETDKALELIERALAADPEDPAVLYNAACVYAQLDQADKALDFLEESVNRGFRHKDWIQNDQDLTPLHNNERFKAIVARLD